MNDLLLEQNHLNHTIQILNDVITDEKDDLNILIKTAKGNDDIWQIINNKEYKIKKLTESLDNPYFARIDFKNNNEQTSQAFYIGKKGLMKNSDIIITDWRAPISSLYYDGNIGECSYNSPEGIINGNMLLKRQFEIIDGKLLSYFDIDLVTKDILLQKYLEKNNDKRLKNIVATIQKEQNNVIRRRISENVIVDGVAGSGKTTVALHKIAYLVYNYSKTIAENKYLVIGPNPVFLKYIKTVLPDLDIQDVNQQTFEDFAIEYIGEKIPINSSIVKAALHIDGKLLNDIDYFKSSMKYKAMLDAFINEFIISLTTTDLKINDFVVLNSHIIKKIFNEIDNSYSFDNRIDHTIKRVIKFIKDNNTQILNNYTDYEMLLYEQASNKEELKKQFLKDRNTIKKYCVSEVKKYFNKSKSNITTLYKRFVETIDNYDIFNYKHLNQLKNETLRNIKKRSYDFEDLAALLYLKNRINPNNDYKKYRHIVIDEAQDLGEFNFYVLKIIFSNATFSIFGDLAQSIFDYRSISSWDKVNRLMFNNTAEIIQFKKSYRTTRQIMHAADQVAIKMGLNPSEMVLREGTPLNYVYPDNIEIFIINRIKQLKEKYKTIAIISKTEEMSKKINERLKKNGLVIPNISIEDDLTDQKYNICTISNQLVKGLEFDAVIIGDASSYQEDSILDLKLLYVAITRALHELDIINWHIS